MSRSTFVALALGVAACHNPSETHAPAEPMIVVPAHDALQVAADEDAARRETEAEAPVEPSGPTPVPEVDKAFAMQAASGGLAEVELSKIALAKAKRPAVKDLAQRMIDDHARANEELEAIVGARGVEVPKAPDRALVVRATALGKLDGAKLEKAYLEQMLADHQKAVELFRAQARNGGDPELREWAARTLPTLEEHLEHVGAMNGVMPPPKKKVSVAWTPMKPAPRPTNLLMQ